MSPSRVTLALALAAALLACSSAQETSCTYTIKQGDTFWGIATVRGLTVQAVTILNPGIEPTALWVGQVINIPCSVAGDGCKYTIVAGDSFWSIANARGIPLQAITSLNPGVVPTELQIGQMINVPCPPSGSTPTVPPAPAGPKPVCAKTSYGRGVGTIPNQCPNDKPALDAGLCYPNCADASPIYRGVGPVCWQDCPSGYSDTGLTCHRWWPPHSLPKNSYGRGVGVVPNNCGNKVYDAGLCYNGCASGTNGVGPVCWGVCGGAHPVDCGAFCAKDSSACTALGVRIGQTAAGLALTIVGCVGTGFAGCIEVVGSAGLLGLEGLQAVVEMVELNKFCGQ